MLKNNWEHLEENSRLGLQKSPPEECHWASLPRSCYLGHCQNDGDSGDSNSLCQEPTNTVIQIHEAGAVTAAALHSPSVSDWTQMQHCPTCAQFSSLAAQCQSSWSMPLLQVCSPNVTRMHLVGRTCSEPRNLPTREPGKCNFVFNFFSFPDCTWGRPKRRELEWRWCQTSSTSTTGVSV